MLLALSYVTYVFIGWFKFLILKFLYEYWPWSPFLDLNANHMTWLQSLAENKNCVDGEENDGDVLKQENQDLAGTKSNPQ